MKHLILGGSGFVGHAIVRALHRQGDEVCVLNRGNRQVAEAAQLTADRNDAAAASAAVKGHEFDCLVDTNCYRPEQARIAVDALKDRARSVILISSAAVYADTARAVPNEDEPVGGASIWGDYGRDKSASEAVYEDAAGQFGFVVALRPPYIFGSNNDIDRERWFWRRMLSGRPILLPGDGRAKMQFIHEDDLGDAVAAVARTDSDLRGFSAFNVASPETPSMDDYVALLARAAHLDHEAIHVGDAAEGLPARRWFPFRDSDVAVDPGRFIEYFEWQPGADLDARFSETFEALKDQINAFGRDWTAVESHLLARCRKAS